VVHPGSGGVQVAQVDAPIAADHRIVVQPALIARDAGVAAGEIEDVLAHRSASVPLPCAQKRACWRATISRPSVGPAMERARRVSTGGGPSHDDARSAWRGCRCGMAPASRGHDGKRPPTEHPLGRRVQLLPDGTFILAVGSCEMGNGIVTAHKQRRVDRGVGAPATSPSSSPTPTARPYDTATFASPARVCGGKAAI